MSLSIFFCFADLFFICSSIFLVSVSFLLLSLPCLPFFPSSLAHSISLMTGSYPSPEQLVRTEVLEYALGLSKADFVLPNFQTFKLVHAFQLIEAGLPKKVSNIIIMWLSYDFTQFYFNFHYIYVSIKYDFSNLCLNKWKFILIFA